jgi:hypothetical protein
MLLTGRRHDRARLAASLLSDAGHTDIGMVGGVAEAVMLRDGRRRVGREDASLPWDACVDSALLSGNPD